MNEPEEPLNPYVIGSAVGNSSAFVGRDDVLQKVYSVLQHQHQNNAIVLYGQRRIGKTSILKELEAQLAQDGYLPIFFDLQDKGKLPLKQVNQELADKISDKLNSPSKPALEEMLSHWQSPQKLVILFDEFEAVAGNEFEERQASEAFFPYWRNILAKVDKAKLNFVFTTGREVKDLNQKAMSLLKEFPSKKVSLLNETQTEKLIKLSESNTNNTLKWNENTIQVVWEQTGGHPFITQVLCYCIWNDLYENQSRRKPPIVKVANVKDNLANALETGGNAFQWLWNGLPATEKLVTSLLSTQNKPITAQALEQLLKDNGLRIANQEQQRATLMLQQWDVIKPEQDMKETFRFCVELFRCWIAKEKPLPKVQQELDSSENQALKFYEAGRNLRATGQLEAAIDNLEKALKLNPNHISANELLTETYRDQKNWEKAWQTAKAFSLLRPKLARPLLSQTLEKLIAGQNEDKQLHYYEETLKIDPDLTEVKQKRHKIWQQRGDKAHKAGQLDKALEAYKKADLSDKVALVKKAIWQQKGDVAYKNGQLNEALKAYQKAESSKKVAMVEGDIAYQSGDLETALKAYQKAWLDAKVILVEKAIWQQKGDIAYKNGQLNEALKAYQKAELGKKVAMVEGDIAYQSGQLNEALEAYQKAKLGDKVALVEKAIWQQKGDVAYKNGQLNKALEAYQKAGLNDKVALVSGDIAYQTGDLETALEYYKQAKSDDKIAEVEQLQMAQSKIGSYLNELIEQSNGIEAILLYDTKHKKIFYNPNSVEPHKNLLALKFVFQKLLKNVKNLSSNMTYSGKFQHAIFPFVSKGSFQVYFMEELPCMIGFVSSASMGIAISESGKLLKRLMAQKEQISMFFS